MFVVLLALLTIHEMDAIRAREWRMFAVLKDLPDDVAYRIFTAAHLPLLVAIFLVMARGSASANEVLHFAVDIFLIGHTIVHFCFRNNPNNGFGSAFSRIIIYSMGALAVLHLLLRLL